MVKMVNSIWLACCVFLDHAVVWTVRYEAARFFVSNLIYDNHVGNDLTHHYVLISVLSIQPKQFDTYFGLASLDRIKKGNAVWLSHHEHFI